MTLPIATQSINNKITPDENAIQQFKILLRGEIVRPGDPSYDDARKIYNAMIDKRPALIVRCVDVADVIAAVNFGRDNGMTIAIRGGGHNLGGLATCDDSLVIDLSRMRSTRVDPANSTIRVEGGCNWEDVDHAGHPFGLAVPAGFVSNTGVAGLTLGGGHGYLTRKYGLTIDNLLSADIVLAEGRFVTASADENPDLFWALRGGGGNFGVVTSFLFKAHPVSTVYGGLMFWSFDKTAEVMRWYADFIAKAPEDIYGWCGTLTVPPAAPFPESLHGQKVCGIMWCYLGSLDKAEQAFEPIRGFGQPVMDWVGPIPFPALNSMFNAAYPPNQLQWYIKGDIFEELSDEAIALHVKYSAQLPTLLSTMHLYPINGAVHRVGEQDTPWTYRKALFSATYVGVDPDPANNPRMIQWCKDYWLALHPHSAGGAYVNFLMDDSQDRVEASYRGNYARLVKVKAKYDPQNLFHVNQNIKPV